MQVDAARQDVEQRDIGDRFAAAHVERAQLGTAAREAVERPVGEPRAAGGVQRLQRDAHAGRVVAEAARDEPDGGVRSGGGGGEADAAPEARVPGEPVPAAGDARDAAEVRGEREVGEDARQDGVGEAGEGRRRRWGRRVDDVVAGACRRRRCPAVARTVAARRAVSRRRQAALSDRR